MKITVVVRIAFVGGMVLVATMVASANIVRMVISKQDEHI